jgi:hypothetical protein
VYDTSLALTFDRNAAGLVALLEEVKPFFSEIAKAKTAKIGTFESCSEAPILLHRFASMCSAHFD